MAGNDHTAAMITVVAMIFLFKYITLQFQFDFYRNVTEYRIVILSVLYDIVPGMKKHTTRALVIRKKVRSLPTSGTNYLA